MKIASLVLAVGLAAVAIRGGIELVGGAPTVGRDEHTSYFADGGRKEWAEYLDGRRHGACKRWYDDGTLRAEGRYEHGRMEGAWTWYLEDGSIDPARTGDYRDSKRVSD